MSIDFKHITANQTDAAGRRQADRASVSSGNQTGSETSSGAQPVARDSVVLSDKAKVVDSLLSQIAQSPVPSDSKRIEELRQAISSGEYTVSADKIAEKMLTLDFGHRNQG